MSSDPDASPFNALPPIVVALALPIFVIELAFGLGARGLVGGAGAVGWRAEAIGSYAFYPEIADYMVARMVFSPGDAARALGYLFIHYSFTHMLFVVVFLLALGKMVGEIFRPWAVLVVFFGAGLAGAAAYWLLAPAGAPPLVGGYPAVYGLIGAFTFLLWVRLGIEGAPQIRAFTLIGFLLGFQLIFGLLFGSSPDWIADIAGFGAGFLLSFAVSPGGWGRVMAKLRQR